MIDARTILLAFSLATASHAGAITEDGATNAGAAARDAHHGHALHSDATPSDGKRWPTDEPLRAGMSRIEASLAQATTARRARGHEDTAELVRAVRRNVAYIIDHCRLPAAPDAALHELLGRMIAAANQLNEDASSDAAIAELVSVLNDYHLSFDDRPNHGARAEGGARWSSEEAHLQER
jgi:hypothetical protein